MDAEDRREIHEMLNGLLLMVLSTVIVVSIVVIFESRRERQRIETHESGHAVVAWTSGMTPLEISVFYGGGVTRLEFLDGDLTPERYLTMILAGIAAEKLILGDWSVIGSFSDMRYARMAIYEMTAGHEDYWGMYVPTCCWLETDDEPMTDERMARLIDQGIDQATFILQIHQPQFKAVKIAVAGRDGLNEEELRKLLPLTPNGNDGRSQI